MSAPAPRWNLTTIFSDIEGDDVRREFDAIRAIQRDLDAFLLRSGISDPKPAESSGSRNAAPMPAADAVNGVLPLMNELLLRLDTLGAFIQGYVTTDSLNRSAARRLSEVEQLELGLKTAVTRLKAWLRERAGELDAICEADPAREHRLVLEDLIEDSRHLMEPRLEDLAAELSLSGGAAMWKLQGGLTSLLQVPFERNGRTETLPVTVIRALASDPDPDVRRRAYDAELRAWESIREPVAFAMNGVKGSAQTLARWRGYDSVLDVSLEQNRIDRATLDALLGSIHDAFPMFRRYLNMKARRLGHQEKLPWWDLLAPTGTDNPRYSWAESCDFIVTRFGSFHPDLAAFARRAFDERWIDAEPRKGKRGGAFCMKIPAREESRILSNFDGSFDQMITVAHELGHAWHNHCQRGLPMLLRGAPMTLAETASIFCETIVFNAALESAPAAQQLGVLENQLLGATQVCVDIYSRFLFEEEVFKRRADAELSADDLCSIMLDAQKVTYGDALDPQHLHPYMWLMKPHYYEMSLNYYNYPYAFGQLFGLGVYDLYRREGTAFVPRYIELLRRTGAGKADALAAGFGIDLRSREFWKGSLRILEEQVERYCAIPV